MTAIEQLNSALAGRYSIEREVGAGGMATVYLARDLKHDRRVALKVLKPELGAVLGVERFLAEIKVTANLQHPNLLPLFDSGAAEGLLFYVMPFVEGESLRARLDREKQLPVDDAVHIAAAVASALDYAHRQGVIHRDLKPENILLSEGQPLVADFGIALAVSNAGGGRITQTGLSLGTPQYMSPEQATGDRAVDGRTDIYSLGAVTYEMLTGEAPHTGSSSQAIIARVLTEKPRTVRASRASVPMHVEAAVEHALEKLAADRFATAKEFADAVTGKVILATTQATEARAAAAGARTGLSRRERALVALTVVAFTVAGVASVRAFRPGRASSDANVTRFAFSTPPSSGPLAVSVSPDGKHITYGGTGDDLSRALWMRRIDATEAAPVRGTEGVGGAFWSPDSKQFAFTQDGNLKRMSVDGGAAQTIATLAQGGGGFQGAWLSDSTIIFTYSGRVFRVPLSSGTVAEIDLGPQPSQGWFGPSPLPDGKHFLVLARRGESAASAIHVASVAGGAPVELMVSQSRVEFVPPNHLLFVRDNVLYSQELDPVRFVLLGSPERVAEPVGENASNGQAGFSASRNGTLVHRTVSSGTRYQLRWYDRRGAQIDSVGAPIADLYEGALAPDGRRFAFTTRFGGRLPREVQVLDLGTGIVSELVRDSGSLNGVLWSRDSRSVTFRDYSAQPELRVRQLGGAAVSTLYRHATGAQLTAEDYSPDGGTLLVRTQDSLFSVDVRTAGKLRLLARIGRIDQARFSPDGKRVSYGTDESGRWEVYVARYPEMDNRVKVSATGGMQARWRADGREIFYLNPIGRAMAAQADPARPGEFKAPVELFATPRNSPSAVVDQWEVSSDGRRFLIGANILREGAEAMSLTVVLNWMSALKQP